MADLQQGLPGLPHQMVDKDGAPIAPWYRFFVNMLQRTGGTNASLSPLLDGITTNIGSLLFRASGGWIGLNPGAEGQILQIHDDLPEWGDFSPSNFGPQAKNTFIAAPAGATGNATFRKIATADLVPIEGQFPGTATNDNAAAGNIGEYISSQIPAGGAIALASGTAKDITSIALTPGDWDVWGSVATAPAGTTTQSQILGWASATSATDPGAPNSGCYADLNLPIAAGLPQVIPIGSTRISIAANTTIFLSAKVTFAVSTLSAYGFLGARRRR